MNTLNIEYRDKEKILHSPTCPHWVKVALIDLDQRDVVDVLAGIEVLNMFFMSKYDATITKEKS
jgi:hypothetical protein